MLACRLCTPGRSYTISIVAPGRDPAAFKRWDQLPEPQLVKGARTIRAKLQVARADRGEEDSDESSEEADGSDDSDDSDGGDGLGERTQSQRIGGAE